LRRSLLRTALARYRKIGLLRLRLPTSPRLEDGHRRELREVGTPGRRLSAAALDSGRSGEMDPMRAGRVDSAQPPSSISRGVLCLPYGHEVLYGVRPRAVEPGPSTELHAHLVVSRRRPRDDGRQPGATTTSRPADPSPEDLADSRPPANEVAIMDAVYSNHEPTGR